MVSAESLREPFYWNGRRARAYIGTPRQLPIIPVAALDVQLLFLAFHRRVARASFLQSPLLLPSHLLLRPFSLDFLRSRRSANARL